MTCATDTFKSLCAALAALVALAPSPGRAGEAGGMIEMSGVDIQSLLDLSVEAVTRRVERASEAPATVFVLTGDDIRRQGFRTVDEVLGSVPGLFSYPGRFPQVGVRGLGVIGDYSTRLLVLIDGHPLNNSVGVDLGRGLPLPLAAITRVEVIKGPVGSVYGPSAFYGVVNLVTSATPHASEAWAGVEGGQKLVHAGEGSATWRGGIGPAEALVSADVFDTRGLDWHFPELIGQPGAPADGTARGMDFGDAANAYLRARYKGLSASGACGHSFSGIPFQANPDRHSSLEGLNCYGDLALEGDVSEGLKLRGRVAYDAFEQGASRVTPPPPQGLGLFTDKGHDRYLTGELRADWRPFDRLRLDLGSTLQLHAVYQHSYGDPATGIDVVMKRDIRTSNTWALAEVSAGPLTLHGGLTFFAHSIFGNELTPKVAAVWQPGASDTLKAIWSRGFRPPTVVEALLDDQVFFVANPGLKPETVTSTELAYEHRFGGVASVAASGFVNQYQNLIRYETIPAPGLTQPPNPLNPGDFRQQAENAGALELVGGEVAVTLRFGDALQAYGGLSLQHVNQSSRANFPELTGNLALSTRALWHPLTLSVRGTGVGPRKKDPATLTPGVDTDVPTAISLSGQASLDVPGVPGLKVELSVINILDTQALSPAPGEDAPITALPIAPRTYRADLRYQF
jgi:outer membrane receptor for ferrienterochelin and colicins